MGAMEMPLLIRCILWSRSWIQTWSNQVFKVGQRFFPQEDHGSLCSPPSTTSTRDVPGMDFWDSASTLKQYFAWPKNGSEYYFKYIAFAFPVFQILGLGTSLTGTVLHQLVLRLMLRLGSVYWLSSRRSSYLGSR